MLFQLCKNLVFRNILMQIFSPQKIFEEKKVVKKEN